MKKNDTIPQNSSIMERAQAERLRDSGSITPETFNRLFPNVPSESPEAQPLPEISEEELMSQPQEPLMEQPLEEPSLEEQPLQEETPLMLQEDLIPQDPSDQQVDVASQIINQDAQAEEQKQAAQDEVDIQSSSQMEALEQQKADEAQLKAIDSEIKQLQDKYKNYSMEDIFDDENAPISRTRSIIAIMLGAIGQGLTGGNVNYGLQAVNKTMDDFFKQKRTSFKEQIALKDRVYDLIKTKLIERSRQTQNKLTQARIAQTYNQTEMQQSASQQQLYKQLQKEMLQKKMMSPAGLNPEDFRLLDERDKQKAIQFADGKFRVLTTGNIENANKIRTQFQESSKGLQQIDELIRMANTSYNPMSSEFFKARAEADSIQKMLIGSLRLELFGPGVLQKFEREQAEKMIPNPMDILSFDALSKERLYSLRNKIIHSQKENLRSNGIQIPKSKNDKILEDFMKTSEGKKMNKLEAINFLVENDKWEPETLPFSGE